MRDNALQALTHRGQLRLHLGEVEAGKWLDRIESPPSLAKKLGINPGTRVHLVSSPLEVRDVLSDAGAEMVSLSDAELAFVAVSYTHLDVYKRQRPSHRNACARHA